MKTNIVLIGFMGAGKTEVGRILAINLGFNFLDIDALIEKYEEMSITEIFKKKGEKYFRDLETKILNSIRETIKGFELSGKDKPSVISTGGGMPAFNGNMKLLKNIGTVIYLRADARTIYERIKSETHRPVLGESGFTEKTVSDKLKEREKFYEKADMIIYTEGLTLQAVAEEIEFFFNFC